MATPTEISKNEIPKASPPVIGPDLNDANLVDIIKKESIPMSNTNPKVIAPQIDVASAPVMVTPLNQLQRVPAWIDCPFCKRMTKTIAQDDVTKEETSGLVICLICLVCFPLLFCLPTNETHRHIHRCSKCSATVAIRAQDGSIEVKEPMPAKQVPSKYGAVQDQVEEKPVVSSYFI